MLGSIIVRVFADAKGMLQFFVLAPIAIFGGCRTEIARALTRANYDMKIGKFEMDDRRWKPSFPFDPTVQRDAAWRRVD